MAGVEDGIDWSSDLEFEAVEAQVESEGGLWRVLVELAPYGVFLETVEGRILDVNEAGARMFGYTREEMIGLGISDLVPEEFGESLPPEVTRVTGPREVRRYNRRKDGGIFPTEISTRFISVGGERRLLAYVRDISESVNAVQELQAALEKVKALFDIVPICMSCGDVRNDRGYWTRVEDFFAEHAGTQFSHGLCPDCLPRLYPEYAAEMPPEERGEGQGRLVRQETPAAVD